MVGGGPTCWALRTALGLDEVNIHLAALEDAGLLGISEEDGRATVWLPARTPGLPVEGIWEPVPARDWHVDWQRRLQPVAVGALTITPPWLPHDDDALVIAPGQAFGTGHHETTTGCLAALQDLPLTGRRVLDVGTGSGVLAIAAARLGAARVIAVDTDPLAVEAAARNALVNHVAVEVRAGSADTVDEPFDVVLANLDTATLVRLAGPLVARLAPGGALVASGVSLERADEASKAFADAGLPVLVRPGREWAVLLGRAAR